MPSKSLLEKAAGTKEPLKISIDSFTVDEDINPRCEINKEAVDDYANVIERGEGLPPLLLVYDKNKEKLYLAGGFHRYYANLKLKMKEIFAIIKLGTKKDAFIEAIKDNKENGLRYKSEDKKYIIEKLWHENKFKEDSQGKIADWIGVTQQYVSKIHKKLSLTTGCESRKHVTGKDGRKINVSAIGKSKSKTSLPGASSKKTNDTPLTKSESSSSEIETETSSTNTDSKSQNINKKEDESANRIQFIFKAQEFQNIVKNANEISLCHRDTLKILNSIKRQLENIIKTYK